MSKSTDDIEITSEFKVIGIHLVAAAPAFDEVCAVLNVGEGKNIAVEFSSTLAGTFMLAMKAELEKLLAKTETKGVVGQPMAFADAKPFAAPNGPKGLLIQAETFQIPIVLDLAGIEKVRAALSKLEEMTKQPPKDSRH